jgi:thiol-disulfide isomerase/thioredoxin
MARFSFDSAVQYAGRWAVMLTVLVAGCSADSKKAPETAGDSGPPRINPPRSSAVELEPASWDEVQRFIASQKGKVVVVDVWSTTCASCAEEFPGFVGLQRKFEQNDVVCVSFNCDYDGIEGKPPEYYREGVLTFLTARQATTKNFLSTVAFTDLIEPPASLTFPLALVYGRDGKLAKRFDNEQFAAGQDPFTYDDVAGFIATLTDKP